jgi:hypothetical protein
LKTIDPPYYVLAGALDSADVYESNVQAYCERAPRVWIEAGWRHPLAEQIHPPPGKCLCLRPSRTWAWRDEKPFVTGIDADSLAIARESRRQRTATLSPSQRLPVPLRLERFVTSMDARLLGRFTFAISEGANRPIMLLRLRPSKEPRPVLVDLSAGYKPLLKLANVFIPCGSRLLPLPRRDTLCRFLAGDPKRLTWLRPLENGAFRAESLPLLAFRPLLSWVKHASEFAECSHRAWQQSRFGDWERFVDREPRLKLGAAAVAKDTPAATADDERPTPAKTAAVPGLFSRIRKLSKSILRRPSGKPVRLPDAAASTAEAYEGAKTTECQPWSFWRIEGPGFIWNFRVLPHVHTYVNIKSVKA